AVAQVLNRHTLEQVAVWRGKVKPYKFAEELFKLGLYYNMGLLTSEVEGGGYATIGALQQMNYPYIYHRQRADNTPGKETDIAGWSTTRQSKNLLLGWLVQTIAQGARAKARGERDYFRIHHNITYEEMKGYVSLENGDFGPSDEKMFDDCVMSLGITVTCHLQEPPPPPPGSGFLQHPENVGDDSGGLMPIHETQPVW